MTKWRRINRKGFALTTFSKAFPKFPTDYLVGSTGLSRETTNVDGGDQGHAPVEYRNMTLMV